MHALQRTTLALSLLSLAALPAAAQTTHQKPATPVAKQEPKPPARPPDQKPKPPEPAKHVGIGEEVDGSIALTDTDGKTHMLREYRGKPLVITMWSIDCVACKQYHDRLKKLSDDSKGAVVLAVDPNANELDPGADQFKRIKDYIAKNPMGATFMSDPGDKLSDKLGATMTPEIFVIDAKGMLRYKGAIDDDPKGEKGDKANMYVRKALEEVSADKPVTTPSTTTDGSPIRRGAAPKPPEKKPEPPPPAKKPEEKKPAPPPPKKKGG